MKSVTKLSLKQLSFIGTVTMFFLASCTVQKRVYMSGYHVQWLNSRHLSGKSNADREQLTNRGAENKAENKSVLVIQTEPSINVDDNSSPQMVGDNNITASLVDNDKIIPLKNKGFNFFSSNNVKTPDEKKQAKSTFNSEFKKGAKIIMASGDEPKTTGLALTGFILSLVGLFLFGFILGTLAIIFSAIGLGKIKKDTTKWRGKGLAIAGLVIGIIDVIGWLIIVSLL